MKLEISCLGFIALSAATSLFAQVPEDGLTSRELGIRLTAPESRAARIERGEQIYDYWCETCHGTELRKPGTGALAAKYAGTIPAALTERTDLAPELIKLMVRQGISMMPFFRPTEISNPDLDALTEFLARDFGE